MKHDREFWTRHVEGWRASGLTQQMYCRRHRLAKGHIGLLGFDVEADSGREIGSGGSRARRDQRAATELAD